MGVVGHKQSRGARGHLSIRSLPFGGLTADEARRYLETFGFEDPGAADTRLQTLAEDVQVREALASLATPLLEALRQTPDPDAGLSAFVRYVDASPARTTLLRYFADDPRVLSVLVDVTATAPFATELLDPEPGVPLLARRRNQSYAARCDRSR